MKRKPSGGAAHVNEVFAPGVLLILLMFKLKRSPEPESGVTPSLTKAATRSVLIGPAPGKTFPETFQLSLVNPTGETGGLWNVTTLESKAKSP